MNAVIYTKGNCVYCDRAKDLLEDMDIVSTKLPISEYKLQYLGDENASATAPQVFLDGRHVGGYTDLSAELTGS